MDSIQILFKQASPAAPAAVEPRPPVPPACLDASSPGPFAPRRVWRLKANCALSPRQFMLAMGSLMIASACVALCCALRGLWLVPVFCAVEWLVITTAVLVYARHAVDGEIVTLGRDGRVLVQQDRGLRRTTHAFSLATLRLVHSDADSSMLCLRADGCELRLGEHAAPGMLAAFEAEMRLYLRDRRPDLW
jgi:uncharacterized membrane protein